MKRCIHRLNAFPAGEGGPKGRMRVGEQLRIAVQLQQFAAAPRPFSLLRSQLPE